ANSVYLNIPGNETGILYSSGVLIGCFSQGRYLICSNAFAYGFSGDLGTISMSGFYCYIFIKIMNPLYNYLKMSFHFVVAKFLNSDSFGATSLTKMLRMSDIYIGNALQYAFAFAGLNGLLCKFFPVLGFIFMILAFITMPILTQPIPALVCQNLVAVSAVGLVSYIYMIVLDQSIVGVVSIIQISLSVYLQSAAVVLEIFALLLTFPMALTI
ncbi:hypothetical protein MXB_3704, partial [Myxobolus squamalis]